MSKSLEIASRTIGPDYPPYIVAEMSANHNGTLERALEILEAAARTGVDAIKLQTYTPDTLTIDHDGPGFIVRGGLWDGRSLYDLYREAHTPWSWHDALFARGRKLGVPVFSTPFDETAVDFLQGFKPPAFKIASFEILDIPLIRKVAATGAPTVISTGMASYVEIDEAVEAFHAAGGRDLILLHCISGYPTPVEQANLRRIPEMAARYGCPVGLSDHTIGTSVSVAAVALGACFIEKHFIADRRDGGPDLSFSMEPAEMADLVTDARDAFFALGKGGEDRSTAELANKEFRRSLYVVKAMEAGERFTTENVRSIRPGYGLPPKHFAEVLGRRAKKAISRGTPLCFDLME